MKKKVFNTLSQAVDYLTEDGFTEDFKTENNHIVALYSKNKYLPEDIEIVASYRFEDMSNMESQTGLLTLETKDGLKGTMTVYYSAVSDTNFELVRQLKKK